MVPIIACILGRAGDDRGTMVSVACNMSIAENPLMVPTDPLGPKWFPIGFVVIMSALEKNKTDDRSRGNR
jgi:hypothetical protein